MPGSSRWTNFASIMAHYFSIITGSLSINGVSLSEPHIDEFAVNFIYI